MKKIFKTSEGCLRKMYNGQTVEINPDDAIVIGSATMYHIRFDDGYETDAMNDELCDVGACDDYDDGSCGFYDVDLSTYEGKISFV